MDIATIGGLILAIAPVIGSILLGGGLGAFVDVPSIMIVFGGSFASVFVTFPMKKALSTAAVVKNCFLFQLPAPNEVITQFSEFATTARRDGLLALEGAVENIEHPFLKRGIEQVVGALREMIWQQVSTWKSNKSAIGMHPERRSSTRLLPPLLPSG